MSTRVCLSRGSWTKLLCTRRRRARRVPGRSRGRLVPDEASSPSPREGAVPLPSRLGFPRRPSARPSARRTGGAPALLPHSAPHRAQPEPGRRPLHRVLRGQLEGTPSSAGRTDVPGPHPPPTPGAGTRGGGNSRGKSGNSRPPRTRPECGRSGSGSSAQPVPPDCCPAGSRAPDKGPALLLAPAPHLQPRL